MEPSGYIKLNVADTLAACNKYIKAQEAQRKKNKREFFDKEENKMWPFNARSHKEVERRANEKFRHPWKDRSYWERRIENIVKCLSVVSSDQHFYISIEDFETVHKFYTKK